MLLLPLKQKLVTVGMKSKSIHRLLRRRVPAGFGVYLHGLRKRAGLSLRAVQELSTDISYTHLAKIERGDVDCIPQLYVLRGLAAVYNVPLSELAAAAGYNREEAWPSDWLERVSLHSGIKAHPRIWGPLQLEMLQELLQWAAFTDPDDIQNLLSDG